MHFIYRFVFLFDFAKVRENFTILVSFYLGVETFLQKNQQEARVSLLPFDSNKYFYNHNFKLRSILKQ